MSHRDEVPAGPTGPSLGSERILVGRERELGALRDFLDESATRGATLVVSGEPGVGKSALLEAAVARAHDLGQQVVRAAGAEFEVEVTFATLNQLLGPFLGPANATGEVRALLRRLTDRTCTTRQLGSSPARVASSFDACEEDGIRIEQDDLTRSQVHALLREHLDDMTATSPPESVHALDLDGLRHPDVTFWSAWSGAELLGCAALKQLSAVHGEIKSMRTAAAARGRGVASSLLEHLIAEAVRRAYTRLSLETGTQPFFEPARRLYTRCGFASCPPFADYRPDPNSTFMTRPLTPPPG